MAKSSIVMEIIIVRHGQSVANIHDLWQGQIGDADLTPEGVEQANALGKYLAANFPIIDAVYASPLTRAQHTAQKIADNLLLPQPIADDRLKEMHYGDWENLTTKQLEMQYPQEFSNWLTNPQSMTPPGAESLTQILDRSMSFLEEKGNNEGTRIVVVTHAMIVRVLLTKLLHRTLQDIWIYEVDNTSWTLVDWDKHPQVISLNQTDHLQKE